MSIKIEVAYPNATPASASYPFGSFKNATSPTAFDGTPFEKAWPNDFYGFFSKVLNDTGITPSGVPDTILASDYFDGMAKLFERAVSFVDTGTADDYEIDSIRGAAANPAAYFDGQPIIFKATNTNTGASTIEIGSLGAEDLTLDDGTALSGGEVVSGRYIFCVYNLSGTRFELVTTGNKIFMPDNLADAYEITQGANFYYKVDTLNGSEVHSWGTVGTEHMSLSAAGTLQIGVTNNPAVVALSASCNNNNGTVLDLVNDGDNASRYGVSIQGGADDASGQTFYIRCRDGDGDEVGYIENNAGTFQLVDSSDERTKKDWRPTGLDCTGIILGIEVGDFERIKNGQTVVGGFLADQMLTVFESAVSGRPGQTEEYVEQRARGNIIKGKNVIVESDVDIRDYNRNKKSLGKWVKTTDEVVGIRAKMMGVSKSSIVPVLVKAFQDLEGRIAALEKA